MVYRMVDPSLDPPWIDYPSDDLSDEEREDIERNTWLRDEERMKDELKGIR